MEYIQEYQEEFSIDLMCKVVNLPRRTYYDTLNWKKSPRQEKMEQFSEWVSEIFHDFNQEIGSTEIQRILESRGVTCTQQTVWRHMKYNGPLVKTI